MSTILKALRRLEEDKHAQAARSLDQAVLEPVRPSRGGAYRGVGAGVLLGLMVAAGVGALGWSLSSMFFSRGGAGVSEPAAGMEAPVPVAAVPVREAPPAREAVPRARVVPVPRPTAEQRLAAMAADPSPTEGASPARVSAPVPVPVPAPQRERAKAPVVKSAESAKKKPAPERVAKAAAPKLAPESEARLAAASAAKPAAEKKAVPVATPPVAAPMPAPEPAPVVAEAAPAKLPEPKATMTPLERAVAAEASQQKLPDVQKIIWHPKAARRVAIFAVEGQPKPLRLTEGGVVAGYTIAKIGVADVELVKDGVSTKRRLGAN